MVFDVITNTGANSAWCSSWLDQWLIEFSRLLFFDHVRWSCPHKLSTCLFSRDSVVVPRWSFGDRLACAVRAIISGHVTTSFRRTSTASLYWVFDERRRPRNLQHRQCFVSTQKFMLNSYCFIIHFKLAKKFSSWMSNSSTLLHFDDYLWTESHLWILPYRNCIFYKI